MAARTSIINGRILTETALSNLNITRNVQGSPMGMSGSPVSTVPVVAFGINLNYSDTEYLIDETGVKERVLTQGLNPKWIGYSPEQVNKFFSIPMKTAEGINTVLGEFLAEQLDIAIQADLK